MPAKKKIGIIVQRYGKAINGGSEVLAKMLAEKLNINYDVTVLTSRAVDYHTWQPVLKKGVQYENGIKVIRFDHLPKRDHTPEEVHRDNRKARGRLFSQKLYRFLGRPKWYLLRVPEAEISTVTDTKWIELLGPEIKSLLPYLQRKKNDFSAFIFLTYLYYPSAVGMPTVGSKSIFIPTMHDELPAHRPAFKNIMKSPAVIFFLTEAEKEFSEKTFDIAHIPSKVISVGIDVPAASADRNVLSKFNIRDKYALYLGRIEPHKGCAELLEYFSAFIKHNGGNLQLVMAGKNDMPEVTDPAIIYAGFVSDEEKWQLLKQAGVLIIPSRHESLSLVLLESFACKVPVIATAYSEVLKSHIGKSNGGWTYTGYTSFEKAMNEVVSAKTLEEKGAAGFEYVKQNYSWSKVMNQFDEAIRYIEEKNK